MVSSRQASRFVAIVILLTHGNVQGLLSEPADGKSATQYLAFQIFTGARDSEELREAFPPPTRDTAATVAEIIRVVGGVGNAPRKLAFIVGPLSFDNTDDQVRDLIRDSFAVALENNVAVGLHIDDSMFWGRLAYLNTPENIEWLDWSGKLNTGRRVDWSSIPLQVMPQLCVNSPAVQAVVTSRAGLIGEAVSLGIAALQAAGRPELFAGVIAGWETQIGRDFATGEYLGYCALTNKGYSAEYPPADLNEARADVTREFVELWANALVDAGVPATKVFSHTAFLAKARFDYVKFAQPGRFPGTYLETVNFTPPRVAFGGGHYAGFSTYPQFGFLEQVHTERATHSNPPWASVEGTALDPAATDIRSAMPMEQYLGDLFNRGAILVNIFGWDVGGADNLFRRVAQSEDAVAAYRKFLRGELLAQSAAVQLPSSEFFPKMERLRNELPPYFSRYGTVEVGPLYETLRRHLDQGHFADAEAIVDAILAVIER